MRKLLSVLLAVAMVMAIGVTAFAAKDDPALSALVPVPFHYAADGHEMQANDWIQYGSAAYFPLLTFDDKGNTDVSDDITLLATLNGTVDGLKVKAVYDMGADLVESISIVKKNVTDFRFRNTVPTPEFLYASDNAKLIDTDLKTDAFSSGYYYFVEVKTKASTTALTDADVAAKLTLTKSKAPKIIGKEIEIDVAFNIYWNKNWQTSANGYMINVSVDESKTIFAPDTKYLLKFDLDDEVEFMFGTSDAQNEGTFTVDVSGQGKLLVFFDTKANADVEAANPGAITKYVNFNNVRFNRIGEMFLEAPDASFEFLYQIVDGKVQLIDVEYDAADEGFYFKTRTLGAYVLSDVELVNAPEEVPEVEGVPEEPTNPDTGAAA